MLITYVVTVEYGGTPENLVDVIAVALESNGARLIPNNWAADPDTIADAYGVDEMEVFNVE